MGQSHQWWAHWNELLSNSIHKPPIRLKHGHHQVTQTITLSTKARVPQHSDGGSNSTRTARQGDVTTVATATPIIRRRRLTRHNVGVNTTIKHIDSETTTISTNKAKRERQTEAYPTGITEEGGTNGGA
ncbi:hypothetical protein GQ457_06G031910 [Hibiscus cannabinus]